MFEFLSHPLPAVVILLGVLVFVHEFGHFIVGKACGVGVEVFSIGFGPRILGFRHNDTDYRFSWIPLGGYVKFAGALASEDVPERFLGKEMYRTSTRNKFFIIAAGPFANLMLAAFAYMILGMAGVKHTSSVIGEVRPGSAADRAGIMSGDRVTRIDDTKVEKWRDLQKLISVAGGTSLEVEVQRQDDSVTLQLVPDIIERINFNGNLEKAGRAGIGYGFLPPIVSILSSKSDAAIKGLKTGGQILSIKVNGTTYPVKTWSDFQSGLRRSFDAREKTFYFSWVPGDEASSKLTSVSLAADPQKVIERSPIKTEKQSLQLSTAIWQDRRVELETLGRTEGNNALNRTLASLLSLADGQLTVLEAREGLGGDIHKNDRLLAFDGVTLRDIYQLQDVLEKNQNESVVLLVSRGDSQITVSVKLKPVEVQKPAGLQIVYTLPISFFGTFVHPEPFVEQYSNVLDALWYGISTTGRQSGVLVATIYGLFSGDVPIKALGGPMLIAKVAGDSAKMGWQAFLMSMALISINLGMINLFPIPVLDGGQLVIVGIEGIRRKRMSDAAIENFQKIGFVMVMSLVVLATYNDLSRFWASMVKGIAGAF